MKHQLDLEKLRRAKKKRQRKETQREKQQYERWLRRERKRADRIIRKLPRKLKKNAKKGVLTVFSWDPRFQRFERGGGWCGGGSFKGAPEFIAIWALEQGLQVRCSPPYFSAIERRHLKVFW